MGRETEQLRSALIGLEGYRRGAWIPVYSDVERWEYYRAPLSLRRQRVAVRLLATPPERERQAILAMGESSAAALLKDVLVPRTGPARTAEALPVWMERRWGTATWLLCGIDAGVTGFRVRTVIWVAADPRRPDVQELLGRGVPSQALLDGGVVGSVEDSERVYDFVGGGTRELPRWQAEIGDESRSFLGWESVSTFIPGIPGHVREIRFVVSESIVHPLLQGDAPLGNTGVIPSWQAKLSLPAPITRLGDEVAHWSRPDETAPSPDRV